MSLEVILEILLIDGPEVFLFLTFCFLMFLHLFFPLIVIGNYAEAKISSGRIFHSSIRRHTSYSNKSNGIHPLPVDLKTLMNPSSNVRWRLM